MKNKYTITEIKELLKDIKIEETEFFQTLLKDERKGVQNAISSWRKQQKSLQELNNKYIEMNYFENKLYEQGYDLIAGVDEVGRGPLAGPVVAGSVILDKTKPIIGLDDSKKLSLKKRESLYEEILEKAIAYGIGKASAEEIDRYNIYQATKLAMQRAIEVCGKTDYLLVDAMTLKTNIAQKSLVKGDSKSNSIAAASILAKVTRDNYMKEYDKQYPGYGFSKNVGYGTKEHLNGLQEYKATPIHRKTFSPVKKYLIK